MALLETNTAHYFVQVASNRSFTRAATALGTTQSNVTAKIKQLEAQFGQPLVRRHSRGVDLTEAGKRFLGYCEELVRVAEAAQRGVAKGDGAAPELRVGMFHTVAGKLLPEILASFIDANRGVLLKVKVGSTEEMVTHLTNGVIDCAVIAGVGVDASMTVHARVTDELGWLIKAGTLKSTDLMRELSTRPFYCVQKGGLYETSIRQLFDDSGIVANMPLFMELGSLEILKSMLLTGLGFTFISRGVFQREIEEGLFEFHPADTQLPRLYPVLVTRTRQQSSEVVQSFVGHVIRQLAI